MIVIYTLAQKCHINANFTGIKPRLWIVNDCYTAPEVNKDSTVLPSSDIYSIGKIAIELLGGNIYNNGMPVSVDAKVRDFIRKMVTTDLSVRPNDAWNLWSELVELRNEVFGTKRFKKLD